MSTSDTNRLIGGQERAIRFAGAEQLAPLLLDVAALGSGEDEREAGLKKIYSIVE
jgi:hypothetical protein